MLLSFDAERKARSAAGLFCLVPPVTALFAGLVFGGRLGPAAIPGMAVAAPGAAPAWRS